jgi:hypothetical protein
MSKATTFIHDQIADYLKQHRNVRNVIFYEEQEGDVIYHDYRVAPFKFKLDKKNLTASISLGPGEPVTINYSVLPKR